MSVTEYTVDNLVIENAISDDRLLLASGQNVTRGTVLKLNAGKLEAVTADTDVPHSIAVRDVDATAGDAKIAYYVGGVFLENDINYNGATADGMREQFRAVGITTKGAY